MTGQLIGTGADGCPLFDLTERDYQILRNARIVMIGHSMGAIVVNELLQLFPDLPYEFLVYMAGAASVRDTSRAVTPVLVDNLGCTKFYGLMLHPMNEARESNRLWPAAFRQLARLCRRVPRSAENCARPYRWPVAQPARNPARLLSRAGSALDAVPRV